jgi:hypothetical protein
MKAYVQILLNVCTYLPTTRRHILEERNLNIHGRENLKQQQYCGNNNPVRQIVRLVTS